MVWRTKIKTTPSEKQDENNQKYYQSHRVAPCIATILRANRRGRPGSSPGPAWLLLLLALRSGLVGLLGGGLRMLVSYLGVFSALRGVTLAVTVGCR